MAKRDKKTTRADKIAANQDAVQADPTPAAPEGVVTVHTPGPPDPTPADETAAAGGMAGDLSAQITQAWEGLLAMATSQGASRRDIVLMTLTTAHGVMNITGVNLWPIGSDLPRDEAQGFGLFQAALHATEDALKGLNADQV